MKQGKPVEKVIARRDSTNASPRGDVKTRRNSDTGLRKFDDTSESHEEWKREQQRLEKIRAENEKLEKERLEKEKVEKEKETERLEKERQEKERIEKEKAEKERLERERIEREKRKEREERERREKEERERRESEEQLEKERRERKEREEREGKEKEERERERREREERERREREERERREREEKERRDREEKERKEKEEEERLEKERLEKERRREEERKHKDDNHEKRREEHTRYREIHSEPKHRENNVDFRTDKHVHDTKNTKEHRDGQESKKDSYESRNCHDSKESKRHHSERDSDKRKEASKENSLHERSRNCINEIREYKDRPTLESRHMSLDLDKNRQFDTTASNKLESNKRKERNNSLPANIGAKRRISSHDAIDNPEDCKRIKLSAEYKKQSERRDSKDSRTDEKLSKTKHKNSSSKSHEEKQRMERSNSTKEGEDKRKDRDKEDRHRHKQAKLDKQKVKKNRDKETTDTTSSTPSAGKEVSDKEFLARLDLRTAEDVEKQKQQRKEIKEKRKESSESDEKRSEERKKHPSGEKKQRDDVQHKTCDDRNKPQKKDRTRKLTQNSSDNNTDSDEPKKHSIFDIVDDEPAYISMYDKVKARSCKNMQKQEEEKRQEKIKAKFCQLKQSRAKREEKKRSTSWDEDSDSDREKSDTRIRRGNKMLIASSDDDEDRGKQKKRDVYVDSDTEKQKLVKQEMNDEEERIRSRNIQRKGSKSRITSDTSDDEFKKIKLAVKAETFSDMEIENNFGDTDEKPYKKISEEYDKLVKKEKKSGKHQESLEQINAHIFGDSNSPVPEIKQDKFNSSHSCIENSSADESMEVKKEKSEMRKKHKKKQKRQKTTEDDEISSKLDSTMEMLHSDSEKLRHFEKKKQHSKKDKKKDRSKDEERPKEKSKKSKKNKDLSRSDGKHDGKMENIFGPLSEDSENGIRDQDNEVEESANNQSGYFDRFSDDNMQISNYISDSDSVSHEREVYKAEEKERLKEEHRRRKEKKRREKERRLREEFNNENSMDYADMGKLLEENIKDDTAAVVEELKDSEGEKPETFDNSYLFSSTSEQDLSKEVRKELKEKKKKRKKSKEERQSRHHHSHHHDKNKVKSPEEKKESAAEENALPTAETPESKDTQNQSLPTILDIPSPPLNKSSDYSISPVRPHEPLISPIPSTPSTSKDKKREKLLPGFGTEIDEKIHENAVKSIPEFEVPKEDIKPAVEEEAKPEKQIENSDEKPRVVISQEETEDAVAALLGESFGESQFSNCYDEELSQSNEQVATVPEEDNIQQDDEEMRQAVQSLNSGDMEIKPDTPQSENDLQIDTDTEEQEEAVPATHYGQSPRTPDMVDLSQPPKTPDIPIYYRGEEQCKPTTIILKTANIGSPPSLTPIKPHNSVVVETKRNLDNTLQITKSSSLPSLTSITKDEPKTEQKTLPTVISTSTVVTVQAQTISTPLPTTVSCTLRTYSAPPLVKVSDSVYPPSLAALSKPDTIVPTRLEAPKVLPTLTKPSVPPLMHNLPARPPYPQPTQQKIVASSAEAPGLSRVTTSNIQFSRLPITPIMVSKPLQSTTVLLPQPKSLHMEPPKLVSSAEPRQQERPRITYQNASLPQLSGYVQSQPRIILQTAVPGQRTIPTQSILVPAKKTPPFIPSIVPTMACSLPKISKELPPNEKVVLAEPKLLPTSVPVTFSHPMSQTPSIVSPSPKTHAIIITSHSNPQPVISAPEASKPFTPVIQETAKALGMSASAPLETTTPQPSVIHLETSKPVPSSLPPPVLVTLKREEKPEPPKVEEDKKSPMTTSSSVVIVPAAVVSSPAKVELPTPKAEPVEQKPQMAIEKVTEELNLSLKKEEPESKVEPEAKADQKSEVIHAPKDEKEKVEEEKPPVVEELTTTCSKIEVADVKPKDPEVQPVAKETEKFDEEKADTESVLSDTSKERSSAELLNKEDAADSKEDSDYWSAKDVNIDSVIKTLCSADELSDRSSEAGKDEWLDQENKEEKKEPDTTKTQEQDNKDGQSSTETSRVEDESFEEVSENIDDKELATKGRRAGRGRGRKPKGDRPGVQTRRGKAVKEVAKRGGRTGKARAERKVSKSESETSADIYEFRDDSDENNTNKDRPRLILTIKSPALTSNTGANNQTAVVKEVIKEQMPLQQKTTENKEEFASPVSNTRKSRRLQERDVSRNTVDDTIEDVVRNTAIVTRASAAAAQAQTPRRSARQTTSKVIPETPRKSPRGGRKKDRRGSETTDESSEEKSVKSETVSKPEVSAEKEKENIKEEEHKPEPPVKEKPHEGLKATVLRRVKGEMNQEPMTLIDPVTGLLTPMRECEEGRYIPVPGSQQKAIEAPQPQQQSVITAPQTPIVPKQQKPQSLKQHVLSSEAAKAVVSQQQQQQQQQQQPTPQQIQQPQPIQQQQQLHNVCQPQKLYQAKQPIPINQNLNVNVSLPSYVPAHLSPRTKPLHVLSPKPQLSPSQMAAIANQQKQMLQQAKQPIVPKAHLISSQPQVAHVKTPQPQQFMKQQQQQQIVVTKKPPVQMVAGAVPSPPLKSAQLVGSTAARIVQSHLQAKGAMEPPKAEGPCVMVPRPNVSPQGQQARHVLQAGMPVPAYEASLVSGTEWGGSYGFTNRCVEFTNTQLGERSVYNRSRSPPPAHQNSPSPQVIECVNSMRCSFCFVDGKHYYELLEHLTLLYSFLMLRFVRLLH